MGAVYQGLMRGFRALLPYLTVAKTTCLTTYHHVDPEARLTAVINQET